MQAVASVVAASAVGSAAEAVARSVARRASVARPAVVWRKGGGGVGIGGRHPGLQPPGTFKVQLLCAWARVLVPQSALRPCRTLLWCSLDIAASGGAWREWPAGGEEGASCHISPPNKGALNGGDRALTAPQPNTPDGRSMVRVARGVCGEALVEVKGVWRPPNRIAETMWFSILV